MSRNRKQQQDDARDVRESKRSASRTRRRDRAAWAVAALALVVNVPVLLAGFVFDDHPIVEENRRVVEVQLGTIWRTSYWGSAERVGEYRPFVTSTYALEHGLLGPAPVHFHAVNWLLHAAVAVSLLFAGRAIGLGERAAAIAAGVFAIHPIHLDAIAPVVGRAELLAALALGGGTALWVRIRREPEVRPGPLLALAGCVAMGAFSKETALATVPLLAVVELLIVRGTGNRHTLIAATAAVVLAVGAYLIARAVILGGLLPSGGTSFVALANPLVDETHGVRLLTAAAILGTYLRLFVWPANLSPDYSYDSLPVLRSAADPAVWLPFALLVALVALAVACMRRRPAVTTAAVAFLAPYSIVSNAAFPIGTMLAERLFYLPSLGLCWLVGLALADAAERLGTGWLSDPKRVAAAAAVPALALGGVARLSAQYRDVAHPGRNRHPERALGRRNRADEPRDADRPRLRQGVVRQGNDARGAGAAGAGPGGPGTSRRDRSGLPLRPPEPGRRAAPARKPGCSTDPRRARSGDRGRPQAVTLEPSSPPRCCGGRGCYAAFRCAFFFPCHFSMWRRWRSVYAPSR
jgi:hypothetical protein